MLVSPHLRFIPGFGAWENVRSVLDETRQPKRSRSRGFDLRQSGDAQPCHTGKMEIGLTQLRALLSMLVLIAGSVVMGAGLAGQGPGMGADIGALAEFAVPPIGGSSQVTGDVTATDNDGCCEHGADCAYSAASGCCAASISATGECGVVNCPSGTARFMEGMALLATGIDPEALLQPPQTFA
ncbi:hypothetical protein [Mesorhizobium sp.]|uniref:hypothetical protein n=1 Tax=Mesorhizobium sp. TaxID=1871066 RepID=UPI000FE6F9F0|nr:hypothetical protein [Mesorhizobium sp.]RWB25945.1 MAG: hypothetical protein EOQ43_32210 [Mesorhizobium sp.]